MNDNNSGNVNVEDLLLNTNDSNKNEIIDTITTNCIHKLQEKTTSTETTTKKRKKIANPCEWSKNTTRNNRLKEDM